MADRRTDAASYRLRNSHRRRWVWPLMALPMVLASTTVDAAVVPGELLVREGDVPLGAAEVVSAINPPFVLADGTVGFTGLLEGGDAYVFVDDQVVWLNSDELVLSLTTAEASMGASAAGGFIYSPSVDGNDAVWTHNGQLAVGGAQAPVFPAGVITTFHSRPLMTADGTAYWLAGLDITGSGGTEERVLYRSPTAMPGDIEVVLSTADAVGGMEISSSAGLDFDYEVSFNGNHLVAVLFMETGGSNDDGHIYLDGALLHQEDTPNGAGDDWDNFDLVAVNDNGDYIFTGDTNGVSAMDEFIAYNGVIAVRENDIIAGITLVQSAFVRFVGLANNGRVAHAWSYDGGVSESLFYACNPVDLQGSSLAVLTADVDELDLDGDGVGDGLVTDLRATSLQPSRSLAEDGSIYLEIEIDQGMGPVDAMARIPVSCCGNSIVDFDEACDDGNGDDTDGCPGNCAFAVCGDGFVQAGVEECDDGDNTNTDACLNDCTAAACGDGFLWAGVEECDDGNGDDTDQCPGSCTLASCGDGFVWAGNEECDDGNDEETDACLNDCTPATCGDGLVWAGTEECDDANDDDTDECPSNCLTASCGDGFVQAGVEECDDGNDEDGDGCDNDCTMSAETSAGSTGPGSEDSGSSDGGPAGSSSDGGLTSDSGSLDDTAGSTGGGQTSVDTGTPGTGSSSGDTGGSTVTGLDDDGGCTCRSSGDDERAPWAAFGSLMLLMLRRRRRSVRARRRAG
ncbi:MAG: DUF4215 domain-containing protein [Myxococcota bacterium]